MVSSQLPQVLTMTTKSQQPKDKEGAISALDGFIKVLDFAKEVASNTPAKAAFGSVIVILTMVRVSHLLPFYYINCELEYA